MPGKKNQPAPIILDDYIENEEHLVNVRNAQQTLEDKLWFVFEYRTKTQILINTPDDITPEEAVKYGFNAEKGVKLREEQIENGFFDDCKHLATDPGTIEGYRKFFKALGSIKARTVVLSGKYLDTIEKALGENEENREEKAGYLYRVSNLNERAEAAWELGYNSQLKAETELGNKLLPKLFDYKTVTTRQFCQTMGIDLSKMVATEEELDTPLYELKKGTGKKSEKEIKKDVFTSLQNTFSSYCIIQGESEEEEKLTQEQKALYQKGKFISKKAEYVKTDSIQDWINEEGKKIGKDLLMATVISNAKESRYRTQLSGSFGYNTEGFLDREIKKEEARTRYIYDIAGKKKDIEAVKTSIVNKANQKYYAESLRKYPDETPKNASYDNYLTLHSGSKAGDTPDKMVENLSKSLSACALKELDRKFDLKDARKIGEHFREIFALDSLKSDPKKLKEYLQDSNSVLKTGRQLKKLLYGVPADKQQAFSEKMRTLQSHLMPPDNRSKQYKKFYNAVKTCAELEIKTAKMSDEEREKAYCQANLDVFEATRLYMEGKEGIRTKNTGKLSFDHALDAIAICSETSPALRVRTDKIIGNINRVRNNNNPLGPNYINTNSFHQNYGAGHSQRSTADYSRNRNINIVNEPENGIKPPGL